MTPADMLAEFEKMEQDVKSVKSQALRQAWHMRGGLTYSDALNLSPQEREIINDLIKENMEIVKKTNLPYF